jgi:hypothetical protein
MGNLVLALSNAPEAATQTIDNTERRGGLAFENLLSQRD